MFFFERMVMKGSAPTLFDKLMGDNSRGLFQGVVRHLSIDELKDEVARDLEALLNTRSVFSDDLLSKHPACSRSIISYGLKDFAGMSLASTDDRAAICASLVSAINLHEPRLRQVSASLEIHRGSINRLNFSIKALLIVNQDHEPVNFDAMLQPSSLQYAIRKSRPTARIGV